MSSRLNEEKKRQFKALLESMAMEAEVQIKMLFLTADLYVEEYKFEEAARCIGVIEAIMRGAEHDIGA